MRQVKHPDTTYSTGYSSTDKSCRLQARLLAISNPCAGVLLPFVEDSESTRELRVLAKSSFLNIRDTVGGLALVGGQNRQRRLELWETLYRGNKQSDIKPKALPCV